MDAKTCGNCDFFNMANPDDKTKGQCLVNPPSVTLVPQQGIGGPGLAVVSFYPEVEAARMRCRFWETVSVNLQLDLKPA